jgi:hypothetical protein
MDSYGSRCSRRRRGANIVYTVTLATAPSSRTSGKHDRRVHSSRGVEKAEVQIVFIPLRYADVECVPVHANRDSARGVEGAARSGGPYAGADIGERRGHQVVEPPVAILRMGERCTTHLFDESSGTRVCQQAEPECVDNWFASCATRTISEWIVF